MSTSVAGLSTNFFPSAQNGFTTTTSGSVSSGATTVGLASVAGYTNGDVAVFVIDPTDDTKKQTFTGVIDTSGVQVTSVKWTAGTNQAHALGATVVDYETATHWSMVAKGILQEHKQSGAHSNITADSITTTTLTVNNSTTTAGYNALGVAPTTVTALGNRSYTVLFPSVNYTDRLSPGMRLQITRTVAAPTQCTSLNGTNQYYSKSSPAGMTFTDDFTVSAWIKLSSYPTSTDRGIVSRYNGTSGWALRVSTTGQIYLVGVNAGSGNFSLVTSYQSAPLNKWVHVSAQLDMSAFDTATKTNSNVMIDGVDVPASVSRAGSNPTALIQAGNLEIGSENGGTNFFPGKIAQVAIYSAKVTQATILASMNQTLAGNETSLISAYSFNNSINDLNANANNLTAQGSAVATNADSPFGGQADGTISSTLDYAIITKTAFSTNTTLTVQVPEGCTIPTSGGVTAVSYSTHKIPYLFPAQRSKWKIRAIYLAGVTQATSTSYAQYGSRQLTIPVGEWETSFRANMYSDRSSTAIYSNMALSTASSATASNPELQSRIGAEFPSLSSSEFLQLPAVARGDETVASATAYYLLVKSDSASGNIGDQAQQASPTTIMAECAYL